MRRPPLLGLGVRTLIAALRQVFPWLVILAVPAVILLVVSDFRAYAWDFRAFYDAGHQYLHGHSPYGSSSLADLTNQRNFVYPLPAAALFAPLSLLPFGTAAALFIALSALLLCGALWLLDVRDPRCYAAALIGLPTITGLLLGTISPLLAFLLALVWRYRDRGRIVAVALAALVLLKVFLWPVGFLFIARRQWRVVAGAVAIVIGSVLVSAIPVGFESISRWPGLLHAVSSFEAGLSFSVFAAVSQLGGDSVAATLVSVLLGGALVAVGLRAGARRDDSLAFRAFVGTAFALSPIVWPHYLMLLLVPLATARARYSLLWLSLAWIGVPNGFFVDGWLLPIILAALVFSALQLELVRPSWKRVSGRTFRLLAYAALPAALAGTVVIARSASPAVAALRPADATSKASGTAVLRFEKGSSEICTRVWLSGVPRGSRAMLAGLLVAHDLGDRLQTSSCTTVAPSSTVLKAGLHRPSRLTLRIVGPDGHVVLRGRLSRPLDAR